MKKTLSLFLALALSLALVVPVSAADGFGPYSLSDGMGSTWTFRSAKVEARDLKLDENEIVVYPDETFILVQPSSTITYSGDNGTEIEFYAKDGDVYWDLGESRFLAQNDPVIPDTINVDNLFTNATADEEIVAMLAILLWYPDDFKAVYIILDDSGSAQPQQPSGPQVSDWAKDQSPKRRPKVWFRTA